MYHALLKALSDAVSHPAQTLLKLEFRTGESWGGWGKLAFAAHLSGARGARYRLGDACTTSSDPGDKKLELGIEVQS